MLNPSREGDGLNPIEPPYPPCCHQSTASE